MEMIGQICAFFFKGRPNTLDKHIIQTHVDQSDFLIQIFGGLDIKTKSVIENCLMEIRNKQITPLWVHVYPNCQITVYCNGVK
jgi:hypothetical protein